MRRRTHPVEPSSTSAEAAGVDSLQRGLELLRAFRLGETALPEAELARRTGLPPRTTRRLLHTLVAHGFLVRSPNGDAYGLHVASFVVGQTVLNGSTLVRRAAAPLRALAERFGAHALLCVGDRDELLVLAHASGRSLPDPAFGTGARVPVAATAIGHAWLWTQPAAVQGDVIARMRASGPAFATTVWRSFQAIEEHGACHLDHATGSGGVLVAAPLRLRDGTSTALGCVCAAIDVAACTSAVVATATTLGQEVVADRR